MSNEGQLPTITSDAAPTAAWLGAALPTLVAALPGERLRRQRWFASKAQTVRAVSLRDWVAFAAEPPLALALVMVTLADGTTETYFLPLALRPAAEAAQLLGPDLPAAFLRLASPAGEYRLYDACLDAAYARLMLGLMRAGARLPSADGVFTFGHTSALPADYAAAAVRPLRGEQSNTSLMLDHACVLKSYRRLQNGRNPDLEVPLFLTTRAAFPHTPALAGYVEYESAAFGAAVASLQAFVPNTGDGWQHTQAHLHDFYSWVKGTAHGAADGVELARRVQGVSGAYVAEARRLGEITGELHGALAGAAGDPAFAPEPVGYEDLARWVAGADAQLATALALAAAAASRYSAPTGDRLYQFVAAGPYYRQLNAGLLGLAAVGVAKIRHHGDFHLGQVLRTADGFAILDFEGEPARPLAERRAKHLALRDVAGMLRSFDYAAYAGLFAAGLAGDQAAERYGLAWEALVGAAYLDGYLAKTRGAPFLPPAGDLLARTISFFTLEKAVYELVYELNNRPDWVHIPLQYLLSLRQHS